MPLKHPTRTNPKRRPQLPPVLLPRRNKAAVRPHRLVNEPQRGLKPPRRRPLRDAAGDRKHIRCSTCGQAISLLRARASLDEATGINFNPVHAIRSYHIDGAFIFEFPHRLWYLDYARTCTPPCACALWRFWKTVAVRAWTRVEAVRKRPAVVVVLAPRKATTGGHAQPRRRRRRKRRKGAREGWCL